MNREQLWLLLPGPVRRVPADLAAVLALVGLTNLVVFLPVVSDSPVRVVVGLVFLLLAPGYAFVAALFPESGESPYDSGPSANADGGPDSDPNGDALGDRGIDGIERTALSFGLSIAIVPLIGLVLSVTPVGFELVPILAAISAFTVVTTVVAVLRRWEVPDEERFRVPYREWIAAGRSSVFDQSSTADAVLNVALGVAILLAMSSVVFAVAVPQQGEQFTEFYVLTEGEDGELVAANYPEELVAGDPAPIHVGIENNEYRTIDYTVVVQLQRVEGEGNDTVVTERARLDRWSTTLPHNATEIEERELAVDNGTAANFDGPEARVAFLLYRGEPPAQPTRENAYRNLHIWVDVQLANE